MRDAQAKRRLKKPPRNTYNSDKTECKRGHLLAGDNLLINSKGSRSCVECLRKHRQNWAERNPDRPRDAEKNRQNACRWAKANPDKVKENARNQRQKNREKNKEYFREYYQANKERLNEANRQRYRRKNEQALTEAGVLKPTGETMRSGFVDVPVCELQPPFRDVSHAERSEQARGKGRVR